MKILKKIKNKIIKDYSPDTAFRYLPIIDIIKKNQIKSNKILEVGSGDLGITPYLKKKIIGLDINFSEIENKNLEKIKYQGGAFPFLNNSFDLVLNVDSLEHVKKENREDVVNEMFRVAKKYIIIIVPSGEKAERHDINIDNYFQKINKHRDKFLEEHVNNRLPQDKELQNIFVRAGEKYNKKFKIIKNKKINNIFLREIYMRLKISQNIFLSIIYYLFLLLIPFRKYLNFGECYREFYFLKLE